MRHSQSKDQRGIIILLLSQQWLFAAQADEFARSMAGEFCVCLPDIAPMYRAVRQLTLLP